MRLLRLVTFLAVAGLTVAALANLAPGSDGEPDAPAAASGPTDDGPAGFAGECGATGGAGCDGSAAVPRGISGNRAPATPAGEACPGAGYLCAGLDEDEPIRVLHFPDGAGSLSVRVPLPAGEDEATARRLRRAAVRGIEVWQGHPFDLRIVERESGAPAEVVVKWVRQVGGRALGRTRLRYRSGGGEPEYRVVSLSLATRVPGDPSRRADTRTLELTAAHEMGHALGLPHSDDPRDLMYPENTASHPTARDYRTLEALYRIPSGTEIRP